MFQSRGIFVFEPRNYRAYSRDETQGGSSWKTFQCRIETKRLSTSALFYYSFARCGQRIAREIYVSGERYKVTRCRELKPPRFSSGFLPVEKNNRRAERSWLASEHRAKGEKEKKEKRERRRIEKKEHEGGNKGKKKYWKKREKEEERRAGMAC